MSPAEASDFTRRDRTVGLDVENKTVVVGALLDASWLDGEGNTANRRVNRVDRDDANGRTLLVAVCRNIPTTTANRDVGSETALVVHCGENEFGVENLNVGAELNVGSSNNAGAGLVDADGDGLFGLAGDDDVLEVQDDIGDVFLDAGKRCEFVKRFVETNLGDGSTRDGRKQACDAASYPSV